MFFQGLQEWKLFCIGISWQVSPKTCYLLSKPRRTSPGIVQPINSDLVERFFHSLLATKPASLTAVLQLLLHLSLVCVHFKKSNQKSRNTNQEDCQPEQK
jgi:hypothetical protein